MKVKDYILLEASRHSDLIKQVQLHLTEGWHLYGNPYGYYIQGGDDWHYQAMILPIEDPSSPNNLRDYIENVHHWHEELREIVNTLSGRSLNSNKERNTMTFRTTQAQRDYNAQAYGPGSWHEKLRDDFAELERTLTSAIATLEQYRNGGCFDDLLTGPTRAAVWLDAYYNKEKP